MVNNRELGEQFIEIKRKRMLRGSLGRAIKKGVSEARFKLASRKERRRQEKSAIKRIEVQERAKLQRRFIRKQETRKLQKKFDKPQFRLEEARRKAKIAKFQRALRPAIGRTGRPAGAQILEGIGGFGVRPALSAPPKPKPKKRKKQQFFLIRA